MDTIERGKEASKLKEVFFEYLDSYEKDVVEDWKDSEDITVREEMFSQIKAISKIKKYINGRIGIAIAELEGKNV